MNLSLARCAAGFVDPRDDDAREPGRFAEGVSQAVRGQAVRMLPSGAAKSGEIDAKRAGGAKVKGLGDPRDGGGGGAPEGRELNFPSGALEISTGLRERMTALTQEG